MNFQDYQLGKTTKEGVWRTLPSGLKVLVASIRSPLYLNEIRRIQKENVAEMDLNDPDSVIQITAKAMALAILLDWDGATDANGTAIPYSQDVAEQMLYKYEIFREEVSLVATTDANYKAIAEK